MVTISGRHACAKVESFTEANLYNTARFHSLTKGGLRSGEPVSRANLCNISIRNL